MERKRDRVGQERKERGREFHTVGAAKEKERRPLAERISGMMSRDLSADLSCLVGM